MCMWRQRCPELKFSGSGGPPHPGPLGEQYVCALNWRAVSGVTPLSASRKSVHGLARGTAVLPGSEAHSSGVRSAFVPALPSEGFGALLPAGLCHTKCPHYASLWRTLFHYSGWNICLALSDVRMTRVPLLIQHCLLTLGETESLRG